jgi:AcrR family transcriptional regulator
MAKGKVEAGNRREELMHAAARRFARGGFAATSMRDIAKDVGMIAGSMYYHFKSKDALIAAVYERGVTQIEAAVEAAAAAEADPWARLEAVCAAHLEALLAESPFAAVLTADLSRLPGPQRRKVVALRDRYEKQFAAFVDAVAPQTDARLLRLHLLGALNWAPTWYKPGKTRPADIARGFVQALRRR